MASRHPRVCRLALSQVGAAAAGGLVDLLLVQDGLDLVFRHAGGQEVLAHALAVLAVRLLLLALLLEGLLGFPGLPPRHGLGVGLRAGLALLLGPALLFELLELDLSPDAPLFLVLLFGALDCRWD